VFGGKKETGEKTHAIQIRSMNRPEGKKKGGGKGSTTRYSVKFTMQKKDEKRTPKAEVPYLHGFLAFVGGGGGDQIRNAYVGGRGQNKGVGPEFYFKATEKRKEKSIISGTTLPH